MDPSNRLYQIDRCSQTQDDRFWYYEAMAETFEFRGALIKEQGVSFAVVEVSHAVLTGGERSIATERERFEPVFKNVPIVLAARGPDGRARYSGRPDIVKFLTATGWTRIPWKRYKARKKDRNPFRDWA